MRAAYRRWLAGLPPETALPLLTLEAGLIHPFFPDPHWGRVQSLFGGSTAWSKRVARQIHIRKVQARYYRYRRALKGTADLIELLDWPDGPGLLAEAGPLVVGICHFGRMDAAAAALASLERPCTLLVGGPERTRQEGNLHYIRVAGGQRQADHVKAIRIALRALERGELVAVMADVSFSTERAFRYGNAWLKLNPSVGFLAGQTQARVVPLATAPNGRGRIQVLLGPCLAEPMEMALGKWLQLLTDLWPDGVSPIRIRKLTSALTDRLGQLSEEG
ncbi:MAG: hypothetical protein AB7S38_11575 [Vulcanimicrobiota bacterium]